MSWKDIVSSVAPTIATALGSPVAGMATKALLSTVFGDEEIDEKDIDARLTEAMQDPEVLLKVKQCDHDFKVQMKELDIDLERIHAGDRASARDLAKEAGLGPQIMLAIIYVLAFTLVLYTVFTGAVQMTPDQKDIAMYLLGILSAGLLQIMNFFFGSSSGSKEKTQKLGARNE